MLISSYDTNCFEIVFIYFILFLFLNQGNIHSSYTAMQPILKLLLHNRYAIVIKNILRKFQKKCIKDALIELK